MKHKIIYLHIGTTKTGSTSIQTFLAGNAEALRASGYVAYTPERDPDGTGCFGLKTLDKCFDPVRKWTRSSAGLTRWYLQFIQSLRDARTDRIVLSEEVLWDVIAPGGKRRYFSRFVETLKEFADVQVIVYLRRQDRYLMSAYQQQLKSGRMNGLTFREWLSTKRKATEYRERLEWLSSIVGLENITVRPFEQEQFSGGSLQADFSKAIGLDLTETFRVSSKKKNSGMAPFLVELMRCLSFFYSSKSAFGSLLRLRRTGDERYFNKDRQHEFFSPADCHQLMLDYADENRWVAKELLGREDARLFYESLPATDAPWTEFQLQAEDVTRFFAEADFLDEKQKRKMQRQVLSVLNTSPSGFQRQKNRMMILIRRFLLKVS